MLVTALGKYKFFHTVLQKQINLSKKVYDVSLYFEMLQCRLTNDTTEVL